jgi:hypothetical protein
MFKPTPSVLWHNNGNGAFTQAGHGTDIERLLGKALGVVATDVDNDGRVDLLLANGHPDDMIALRAQDVSYKEPLLLFHHDGRRLRNISAKTGPLFSKSFSHGIGGRRLQQRWTRRRPRGM